MPAYGSHYLSRNADSEFVLNNKSDPEHRRVTPIERIHPLDIDVRMRVTVDIQVLQDDSDT